MTVDEVTTIIDQLCDKLGLAVDSMAELVPELARWKIGAAGFIAAICLVCSVLTAIIAIWAWRKGTKMVQAYNAKYDCKLTIDICSSSESYAYTSVICGAAAVILLMIVVSNVYVLIGWITAPNVKAIEYILSLI